MISPKCFQEAWISELRDTRFPRTDPMQIEKSIYTFELLGLLAKSGKKFVFKGGTSLMLLMPGFDRFSIDIDIIGMFSEDELTQLIQETVFLRIEEDVRGESGIPKQHYKFYYTTYSGKEAYVLLDMLDKEILYQKMISLPIKTGLFEVDENLKVMVPTIDEILGDKLTAFAPGTIGIPYGVDKETEIFKQLFDISRLYDHIENLRSVINTYVRIAEQESNYRGNKHTIEGSLKDSFQTAIKICRIDLKGFVEDENSKALRKGISSVGSFLFSGRLTFDEAKIIAAKAALLAIMIHNKREIPNISEYRASSDNLKNLIDKQLPREFGSLQKLKGINPECFFYLYKMSTLTDDYSWVD